MEYNRTDQLSTWSNDQLYLGIHKGHDEDVPAGGDAEDTRHQDCPEPGDGHQVNKHATVQYSSTYLTNVKYD
jgi:hypothetical protein